MDMAVGDSERYPKVDMTNPRQFGQVVRNMTTAYDLTPEHLRQRGREWYPRVHEAVAKGVRRTSLTPHQGAGLVAVVSPNMDFERNNIHAFKELHGLKEADWAAIQRSANQPRTRNAEGGSVSAGRSPEAQSVLKGLSIERAPDSNLVKAHRILRGEDPSDVMPRQTSPKTHSFMTNIEHPEETRHAANGIPMVTIDGRQHDLGNNRMYPWTYSGRGIETAQSRPFSSGKPRPLTRYEHFSRAVATASERRDIDTPQAFQAITWEGGKHLERGGDPNRQKGAVRRGQSYFDPKLARRNS